MVNSFGPKVKNAGELRRSQILTTYGCGALVDFPKLSAIMAGIDEWQVDELLPKSAKIIEHNLQQLLGKECFYQVSSPKIEDRVADNNEDEDEDNEKENAKIKMGYDKLNSADDLRYVFSLPVYRFPTWYYCPKCHRLGRYWEIASDSYEKGVKCKSLTCNFCSPDEGEEGVKLVPSRFIVACLNGHIDDFPYVWWVHQDNGGVCSKCSKNDEPPLSLKYIGSTGGLDSILLECKACGAKKTMAGCMGKFALRHMKCSKAMPWFGKVKQYEWYKDIKECNERPRVLQRSANNVYYAVNKSALTIPPWSNHFQNLFLKEAKIFKQIFEQNNNDVDVLLRYEFNRIPGRYGDNEDEFIKEALEYRNLLKNGNPTVTDEGAFEKNLRMNEYKAFCGSDTDDELFRTKSVQVPEFLTDYISQIKLVKKLREVMVLQGFRRILPLGVSDVSDEDKEENEGNKQKDSESKFSPISKHQEDIKWLPAIELFGEGIFIELNEEKVTGWEKKNNERYSEMYKRHENKNAKWIAKDMFYTGSPRYVLLHTLAHLLIRQISSQCGYATASIKEKIYSTFKNEPYKMCGILIYTAATDTDGSLGGLVREGKTDRMKSTFENMLQEGSWCSNDPLCIEPIGQVQGYMGLNYAACHACTLLPETSCEAMNCLLDRAAIVGTPDNKDIAFFNEVLYGD